MKHVTIITIASVLVASAAPACEMFTDPPDPVADVRIRTTLIRWYWSAFLFSTHDDAERADKIAGRKSVAVYDWLETAGCEMAVMPEDDDFSPTETLKVNCDCKHGTLVIDRWTGVVKDGTGFGLAIIKRAETAVSRR